MLFCIALKSKAHTSLHISLNHHHHELIVDESKVRVSRSTKTPNPKRNERSLHTRPRPHTALAAALAPLTLTPTAGLAVGPSGLTGAHPRLLRHCGVLLLSLPSPSLSPSLAAASSHTRSFPLAAFIRIAKHTSRADSAVRILSHPRVYTRALVDAGRLALALSPSLVHLSRFTHPL